MSLGSHTITNTDGSSVEVQLQGAHIAKWTTSSGLSPIYLSPKAIFKTGKALRGGVPVCWPQFSDVGAFKDAVHGVARNRMWELDESSVADGKAAFNFAIKAGDEKIPNTEASARLTVEASNDTLKITLSATNNSASEPLTFTTALHSYFATNVAATQVKGLDTYAYQDDMLGGKMQAPAPVGPIDKEVDRIYKNVTGEVVLRDEAGKVETVIVSENMPDVVLWNPWIEKTLRLKDLPEDAYKHFVCVEHGAILTPVTLQPGETWTGSQLITSRRYAAQAKL